MNKIARTQVGQYLVSTVEIEGYYIETMVFDADGEEVQCLRTHDLATAQQNHADMVAKYCDDKHIIDLANDLIIANETAQNYADIKDEGTCNFDSLLIDLNGKKTAFIELLQVVSRMELVKMKEPMYKGYYRVGLNLNGQAYRRTKMVQTAFDYLQSKNVPCTIYYQID